MDADTAELPPPRSLWVDTAPAPDRRGRRLPPDADVVVVGAGIAGLTTAYLLAAEGRSVLVLESGEVASGVSGHTTAKVSAQHALKYRYLERRRGADDAARYGRSQLGALDWIARTSAELGIDCGFRVLDSYVYTTDSAQLDELKAETDAAQRAGLPASFTTDVALDVPAVGAVRFTGQGQFHPRQWLLGLAEHIERLGGRIVEDVRVTGVDEWPRPLVRTPRGSVRAGDVVIATHYPILDRGLFFARLDVVRDLVLAGPSSAGKPPPGMYLDARTHHSVRGHGEGEDAVTLAGGEHYRTGDRQDVQARYRRLARWAAEHAGLHRVTHRWSAHDMSTPDSVPYVGRYHPVARRLWVATGFGQWGMTGGTAAGLLLRDAILGRENPAASLYDPNRLDPRSAPAVAKDNATVARYLVGDHVRALATRSAVDDLAPGEATVTRIGTTMAAVYRALDGETRTLSARCTHLGCLVAFNNAERTWDCPCHGSRFALDGTVVQGPAVRPLRRLDGEH
ncbi:FAD-dependent oxidoreductase [Prauserella muralis]|uniref:FAD-dependent oxidoreductase n=1 Tax=Prauserella muralis TaxID=588067 RepID=A0A2V4AZQ5_9PSEU|nr:FAD-dependent oxidoreductase [Prauserella muralis]PXY27366.1 FAD-dependent oxidoreductase [Prauserella muralis]TWE22949.1 glycine/D-amino acid oxidase-like deaminating enzyme [Prauserella muralis]